MAREAAYKIYYWREDGQEALLHQLLEDRYTLADLCGYPTFAHRALSHSLAETPETLEQFHAVLGRGLATRVGKVSIIGLEGTWI